MKKILFPLWLLVPVAAGAYHFGPGQQGLVLDEVSRLVAEAEEHVSQAEAVQASEGSAAARPHYADAEAAYAEALDQLPSDKVNERRKLRLEQAKVRMFLSQLPAANVTLENLLDEMMADPQADPKLLAEVRGALASSQYYLTWLQRLEGAPREAWEPMIDGARQIYKLLAEQAEAEGDQEALQRNKEDLESTIRLARMDLQELQGLPIPSQ